MDIEIKVGQVWRDKDRRRNTVIEIIDLMNAEEAVGLVVGTEETRVYRIDRLQKRWEMVTEKLATEQEIQQVVDDELSRLRTELAEIHDTREAWLNAAVDKLRSEIFGEKYTVPGVRVSVGWPGGRGPKANTIGQCWPGEAASDSVGQIFISPVLIDPVNVLETLVHEMIHAINHANGETGHRGPFKRIAEPIGLEGKMTATHAGEELAEKLATIGNELGKYPHAAINLADKPKVQKTYMRKVVCLSEPDYFIRMTEGKIEEYGTPICPCHHEPMELEL